MRLRGKLDRNQAEIVRALRQAGASVLSLADHGEGCPDLLVGLRGMNLLLEIKDPMQPPSKRRLTEDEKTFHASWSGHIEIVESVEEALNLLS